ncbi:MAG: hypothetical protein ACYC6L_03030 [Anaerolineae bacterium]
MHQINRLIFLIHGFCWACITAAAGRQRPPGGWQAYLEREKVCSRGWYGRLAALPDDAALAAIPFGPSAAAFEFYTGAAAKLGDRFLLLDAPDCLTPQFWTDDYLSPSVISAELGAAFTGQGYAWNKEELHTALHSQACCRQLSALLEQRGLSYEADDIVCEAWGASFEGCVTKYTAQIHRILGFAHSVDIIYDLTVPDAAFLLDAYDYRAIQLEDNLRLFIISNRERTYGLYASTSQSMADQPVRVNLPVGPEALVVRSKQGIRLWPDPEEYTIPGAPPGCGEAAQQVVQYCDGQLQVPVSAGYVYRLAKAPAFITSGLAVSSAELQAILLGGRRSQSLH